MGRGGRAVPYHPGPGMTDKDQMLEVLRRNEEIRRKFFEIESEILTILKFEDLFDRLLSLIQKKFDVPYAWITIFKDAGPECLRSCCDDPGTPGCRMALVHSDEVLPLLEGCDGPLLANTGLSRFDPLHLSPPPADVGSIAVAPLTLDGRLVGSLNQADRSASRFRPDMDVTLLAQLAVKVSLCLSNVTAHEQLARLASCDPLTGLLNRRAMEERLHEEFLRAKRYGAQLSVAFIDMDDFKLVNDSLGHDAGDAMLSHFARRLAKMARKIDACARFAGDEFVIILPNTDHDQACVFMDRVEKFFRFTPVPGIDRYVRFSYGVASTADPEATSPTMLLKRADERLFDRKAVNKAATRPPKAVGSND